MTDARKKIATIIVGKMNPNSESSMQPEMPQEEPSMHEHAASEILDAMQSQDPKALAEALKSFIDMCNSEEPEEESESPMASEPSEY